MKFKNKKSLGGNLLSIGANFIPGLGPVLSPMISQIDKQKDMEKMQQLNMNNPVPTIKNPYGQFAKGGIINTNFKQYDTGSHDSGNDLDVDDKGNANSVNPAASVQNKENAFNIGGKPYVFSDVLTNPKTGNPFNVDAMKINKKYKNANDREDEENSLNIQMTSLSKINDLVRETQEGMQKAYGGYLKKLGLGDYINPDEPVKNMPTLDMFGKVTQPQVVTPETIVNDSNVPKVDNPLDIQYDEQQPSLATDNTKVTDATELPSNIVDPMNDLKMSGSPISLRSNSSSTNKTTDSPLDENNIAIGLKGLGLLKHGYDALQPALHEDAILPDTTKSDNYMRSLNADMTNAKQDVLGVSNAQSNMLRNASGSFNQFQGRESGRFANLQDSLQKINASENEQRNQINAQKGQYEYGKATDVANRQYQTSVNNLQNKAAQKMQSEKFFQDLTTIGSQFNKHQVWKDELKNNEDLQKYTVNEMTSALKMKYPNFEMAPDFVQRLMSGNYTVDDIIKARDLGVSGKTSTETKTTIKT